jgi:hypothetical protein
MKHAHPSYAHIISFQWAEPTIMGVIVWFDIIYLSTLASLTLIILFSEILKISKIISSESKNIVKEI